MVITYPIGGQSTLTVDSFMFFCRILAVSLVPRTVSQLVFYCLHKEWEATKVSFSLF